ncbi:unnamed protein product [Closterium sp. Naga37s-1]|nr:unnamed protein product [Closterium sp. Naga37s-1]
MAAETIKELQMTVGKLVQQLKLVNARLAAAEKRNVTGADEKIGAVSRGSNVKAAVLNKEKGVHRGGTREKQKPEVMVQPKSEAVKEKTLVLQAASVAADATEVIEEPDVKLSKEEAEIPSVDSGNISVKLQMVAADDVEAEIVGEHNSVFPRTGVGIGNLMKLADKENLELEKRGEQLGNGADPPVPLLEAVKGVVDRARPPAATSSRPGEPRSAPRCPVATPWGAALGPRCPVATPWGAALGPRCHVATPWGAALGPRCPVATPWGAARDPPLPRRDALGSRAPPPPPAAPSRRPGKPRSVPLAAAREPPLQRRVRPAKP